MQKSINSKLIGDLKLQPEEQLIINCLSTRLTEENDNEFAKVDLSTIDWNLVLEKSIQWGVTPLLYKIIKKQTFPLQFSDMPDFFLQKIKKFYCETQAHFQIKSTS